MSLKFNYSFFFLYAVQAFHHYLNELVSENKETYSNYSNIKWLNPYLADEYQQIRDELTERLSGKLFSNTKFYHKSISPGCKLCGEGVWSCLFITGICNASCTYCPSSQLTDGVPTTQGLNFERPEMYAEYINKFKFKGVSFSGGEPLLYSDRVLDYLKEIRNSCDPDIYIWMYTNGIKGNRELFESLAKAGLNEVRFDIGAVNYNLKYIEPAWGLFENLTVEIPAVPEKKELIQQLLEPMAKMGVKHLNLHQLRLTPFNASKLLPRGYTIIPAEKPIVLESELAALEILHHAIENNIDLGINYCSFFYKHRFQKAGFRKQINRFFEPESKITEAGYIRQIDKDKIAYSTYNIFNKNNAPLYSGKQELILDKKEYEFIKNTRQIKIDDDVKNLITKVLSKDAPPNDATLFSVWRHETIEKGLRKY